MHLARSIPLLAMLTALLAEQVEASAQALALACLLSMLCLRSVCSCSQACNKAIRWHGC